jgi:uncharacterized protein (DUF885 family)
MISAVRELSDRVAARQLESDFYTRVRRGLPVERLRVQSDTAWQEDADFASSILAELAATAPVNEDDRLTAGFLEHTLGGTISRAANSTHGFTVTPYQSFFSLGVTLQSVFADYAGDGKTYVSLAQDFRDTVIEMRDRLARQREAGILVPKPALAGTRTSLQRSNESAAAVLQAKAPADVRDAAVLAEIGKAFEALLAYLDEGYEADAPATVGMAQYPGGEDYYCTLVREHTASDMSPQQVHQLGLDHVAELYEKMAKLRADMGFHRTEEEFHKQLADDPQVHAQDPAEVEALFLRHMAALEPLIGSYFSVLPKAPYGVARLDAEQEAGMTYGYYEPPTPATSIGRYRWNGANLAGKSLLTYAALIFHELAPGHHFHIARQSENTALPDLRRESFAIGAFNEGWAEYAAGLGWEMGLYAEPLDAYGRLVHERFTAQRLVVDTGLNVMGWGLDKAASYMKANTTESDEQVASEILRYSTDLPAQALAYRAGYVELMRIRTHAQNELGDRFDIRDFHEQVLGPGALPFPVIDAHIKRWISSR